MSQQFFGIVPRIEKERVSYRGFEKRGYCTVDLEREGKDTEDKETYRGLGKERVKVTKRMKIQRLILQIQREQETSKKRSETEL